MDISTSKLVLAAASGGASEKVYVDDVFSTYVYNGIQYTQQFINGIDLAGEGGLVWIKNRDNSRQHSFYDSERNLNKRLRLPYDYAEETMGTSGTLTFNSNGFTVPGGDGDLNASGFGKYVSWAFRKAPGFFDVVTYSGNGDDDRAIPHNLGSEPGMVIVKRTDGVNYWFTYHRSLSSPQTKWLSLNRNDAEMQSNPGVNMWGSMTSTHIGVRNYLSLNDSGYNYVAYIFAHDDASFGTNGDESIIKCGSFTTNGSGQASIDLGFDPQWLIYKRSVGGGESWQILDVMRGWTVNTSGAIELFGNSTSSEAANNGNKPSSSGFILDAGHSGNATYIYMAIRRSHKPPEAATEVFSIDDQSNGNGAGGVSFSDPNFPFDLLLAKRSVVNYAFQAWDRLRGKNSRLELNSVNTQSSGDDGPTFDQMVGYTVGSNGGFLNEYDIITYAFKRAAGFFDIVTYTGNASSRFIEHNLKAVPELIIVKSRTSSSWWYTYSPYIGTNSALAVNNNGSTSTGSSYWNGQTATKTGFYLGNNSDTNGNNFEFVAYLFSSLPGVSKIGSYTGTGSDLNIDCSFTSGARFVMIKRADATGDWFVWDTTRGITSGNDPYYSLNSSAASITNQDYIDPLSSGFTVTSSAPAELNTNGGDYLFLAIA